MKNKNLIFASLGLYFLGRQLYFSNEEPNTNSRIINPVNIKPPLNIPNTKPPLNIPNTKPPIKFPPYSIPTENPDKCCGEFIFEGKAYKGVLNDNNPNNNFENIQLNGFTLHGNSSFIEGRHNLEIGKYYDVCVVTHFGDTLDTSSPGYPLNHKILYKGKMLAVENEASRRQFLILSEEGNDFVKDFSEEFFDNPYDNNYYPVHVRYSLPCTCDCPVEGWTTQFNDLEVSNDFIVNQMIDTQVEQDQNKQFNLQVIPSPFGRTVGCRVVENNGQKLLEVNNCTLVLLNNDNLKYDKTFGVKKVCYEYELSSDKKILILTSGNNYAIDKIDAFSERPFEGCQVNVMNMGGKKRKVIIESEKCLDLVSIYGEELYVKNLKYCLNKCNE